MLQRLHYVLKTTRWREFALAYGDCALCGQTAFIRLFYGDFGVRCLRCGAATNTVALVAAIKELLPTLSSKPLPARSVGGPYFDWLQKQTSELSDSQFFDGVPSGKRSTVSAAKTCRNLPTMMRALLKSPTQKSWSMCRTTALHLAKSTGYSSQADTSSSPYRCPIPHPTPPQNGQHSDRMAASSTTSLPNIIQTPSAGRFSQCEITDSISLIASHRLASKMPPSGP